MAAQSVLRIAVTLACLLACILGGGARAAQAQGNDAVTITGVLTAIEPASDVLIRVFAGQPVTIVLSAPTIDPSLTVLDAIGGVIASNDDADAALGLPSPRDAAVMFTPATNDLALVRVSSYRWTYSGPYTLTVHGAEVAGQTPVSLVQEANGAVIEGTLTPYPDRAARAAYSFPTLAGASIRLTLASEAFDAVLEVYDAAGELVASNDDHAAEIELPARTDSALTFEASVDGMYYILVRSFEDAGSGAYVLIIDGARFGRASVLSAETAREGVCDNVLGSVVGVSSTFGRGYSAENLLDGNPATGWSSRSDDRSPYLIFEVSDGVTVRLDGVVFNGFSASPGYANDSVRAFEVAVAKTLGPPETFTTVLESEAAQENAPQTYPFSPVEARYVLLRPLSNYGGNYFQATEFNACTSLTGLSSGNLSGEPPFIVAGDLTEAQPFVEYRLYAQDNAQMTVTLVSEAFDAVLEIYDSDGRRLADNDNHPPDIVLPHLQDAGLALTLAEPGMITIRARSVVRGGPYVLTIDGSRIQARPPETPLLAPCNDVSSVEVGGSVVGYSSEFGGRWEAEYLNDGSNETGWASAPGAVSARTEYVILSLAGGSRIIEGFRLNPSATGGDSTANNVSRFAVLVSNTIPEPEAFHEVFSTLLSERYRHTLGFELPEPVEARYVMLETRDTFGGRWHAVAEFTVCAVSGG